MLWLATPSGRGVGASMSDAAAKLCGRTMSPILAALVLALAPGVAVRARSEVLEGSIQGQGGPVVGARVTAERGRTPHGITVFSDARGHFRISGVSTGSWELRVRRIGWRDHRQQVEVPAPEQLVTLTREMDAVRLAEQLPANRWLGLLLQQIQDPGQREEFVRQCTYCHQQGSRATRVPREDWEWERLLSLMARMGGVLSPEVRAQVPGWFRAAYDPATAVPALTRDRDAPEFAPAPSPRVRQALIEEWVLGDRSSMQHDLAVHPDGHVYTVDMLQDRLFRLDPATGETASFAIPDDGLGLGGVFAGSGQPLPPNSNAHEGPHSIEVAPDGSLWITLALGNRLGRFDPATQRWKIYRLDDGYYPHTLRFDRKGRIWFTLAVSNQIGRFDPATERFDVVRLPAASFSQAVSLRLLPFFFWLSRHVDLGEAAAEGGAGALPVPYGIDVAPDGSVWFSQLNQHRIGRVDPESLKVEMFDTPFAAPRRLRFDRQGGLWIPGFSSSVVARFDPESHTFQTWPLPIQPRGTETPYALHVDPHSDAVWICGTNSDSLIRFDPHTQHFDVYPLPSRVTYTREIDFDAQGRVWTTNSNLPAWQVERGLPRVIRLDPRLPQAPPTPETPLEESPVKQEPQG